MDLVLTFRRIVCWVTDPSIFYSLVYTSFPSFGDFCLFFLRSILSIQGDFFIFPGKMDLRTWISNPSKGLMCKSFSFLNLFCLSLL